MKCIIDGHYGIYVPQNFAEIFDMKEYGVSDENRDTLLAGPDHEHYWEAWDTVLATAIFKDSEGVLWRLYQDSDLYVYDTDEEVEAFSGAGLI